MSEINGGNRMSEINGPCMHSSAIASVYNIGIGVCIKWCMQAQGYH